MNKFRQLRVRRALLQFKNDPLRTRRALSHRLCTAKAPFWFSKEYLWTAVTPFWLSTDDLLKSICDFYAQKVFVCHHNVCLTLEHVSSPWSSKICLISTQIIGRNSGLGIHGRSLLWQWESDFWCQWKWVHDSYQVALWRKRRNRYR